jgi:cytochrome b subunit of formate dehydrogenase
MTGWLRNIIVTILLAAVGLAIWKIYGGNVGSFFQTVWDIFYGIVNGVSNVIVSAIHTVTSNAKS